MIPFQITKVCAVDKFERKTSVSNMCFYANLNFDGHDVMKKLFRISYLNFLVCERGHIL